MEEPHSNVDDIKKRPTNLHTVIKNGREFKPLNPYKPCVPDEGH